MGGCGTRQIDLPVDHEVTKLGGSRSWLESHAIEGDSPVWVRDIIDSGILSRAGHVKPCLNLAGPSAKAKYS